LEGVGFQRDDAVLGVTSKPENWESNPPDPDQKNVTAAPIERIAATDHRTNFLVLRNVVSMGG
jgi:hypothetical protein